MIVEGIISSIAVGGEGILRYEGLVVFIPFTLVGETVRAEITQTKKNFARAKLLAILNQSPARTDPKCVHFGKCGGCQFQHAIYREQVSYKRHFIEDSLRKFANIDLKLNDFLATDHIWGYRRRIRLTLEPHNNAFIAGYIDNNYQFLCIRECPIFHQTTDSIILDIQAVLATLENRDQQKGSVTIFKEEQGDYLFLFEFEKSLPKNFQEAVAFKNYIAKDQEKTLIKGRAESNFIIDTLNIKSSPLCFTQNHPQQSVKIYETIKKLCIPYTQILDLYCGIGISSLMAAGAQSTVMGIENNPIAIDCAKHNAKVNNIKAEFICANVEKILPKLNFRPELIIVNPPRIGLKKEVVQQIIRQEAQSIIYVSCMPVTLARDLKHFCNAGYTCDYAMGIDLFPQTHHVETLIKIDKVS